MYAVIRLRSTINAKPDIKETLKRLRLHRINHCVIVPENKHYEGMLRKVKDYVAYGVINAETLALIIRRRGRLEGNKRVTDEYVREYTKYNSIEELAKAIINQECKIKDLKKFKPVFRLHPPRKGHRGNKKPVSQGGELGFHEDINTLLYKMR